MTVGVFLSIWEEAGKPIIHLAPGELLRTGKATEPPRYKRATPGGRQGVAGREAEMKETKKRTLTNAPLPSKRGSICCKGYTLSPRGQRALDIMRLARAAFCKPARTVLISIAGPIPGTAGGKRLVQEEGGEMTSWLGKLYEKIWRKVGGKVTEIIRDDQSRLRSFLLVFWGCILAGKMAGKYWWQILLGFLLGVLCGHFWR
jgi:hypothetical protein